MVVRIYWIKRKDDSLRQGSQRQRPAENVSVRSSWVAICKPESPAPSKVGAATVGWGPELPFLTFFLRTVATASVTNPWASHLTSLQFILHSVFRCQSDLLKQKPNYVTSLLKILKRFPMKAVFFKLLFLAAKPFFQTKA